MERRIVRTLLPVYGLSCGGGGALTVERALARVPGVVRVYVNPGTEMAYIQYDPDVVGSPELRRAIEQAGLRVGTPAHG